MNNKGYTLIELLLVIGLLAIAAGVTSDIVLSLVRAYNKTQITNEIEQNANFVTLKLEKELRNAATVNSATASQLDFVDRNDVVISYRLNSDILERSQGGGSYLPLTNNASVGGVSVSCAGAVCFNRIGGGLPYVIKLNMIFTQKGSPGVSFTGNVTLDNVIVVRGTY